MRLRLDVSAEFTPVLRVGGPLLALFLSGAVLVNWFNGTPLDGIDTGQRVLAVVAGLAYVGWVFGGLVDLRLQGPLLVVSGLFRTETIPAEQVDYVTRWWLPRLGAVTIRFRERTPFGRSVSFIPPASLLDMVGLSMFDNDAVDELQRYLDHYPPAVVRARQPRHP